MSIRNLPSWNRNAGLAIIFSALLGAAGCGGSGGSGGGGTDDSDSGGGGTVNEQAATIQTEQDAQLGADAAVESSYQAIIDDSSPDVGLPVGITIAENSHQDWLMKHSLDLAELGQTPTGAVYDVAGDCGGNAQVNYNEDFSQYRVNYNNYCTSGYQNQPYTIDGYLDSFGDDNLEGEWGYNFDYTVSYLGETNRYRGTYRCNGNNYANCSYSSNYEGRNGRSYRTENVNVSQNGNAYNVSARVYDQELGYLDYQASNLTLCEGGYGFSSGSISVTDSSGGNVLTITFSGCTSFTVTFQGSAYTIDY